MFGFQDFLNMYFKDVYKPIPPVYNLVLAMLWRHPENVEVDKVKVVHYCAAVRRLSSDFKLIKETVILKFLCDKFTGSEAMEVHWKGRKHGQK